MIRQYLAKRRLAKSLRPNPEQRKRRFAQFMPGRVVRYQINAMLVNKPELAAEVDALRRARRDGEARLFWVNAVRLRNGQS